jgi:hypothetical protein
MVCVGSCLLLPSQILLLCQKSPYLGVCISGRVKDTRKECKRMNIVSILLVMCKHGKMRHVETVPGMEEKENDLGGEYSYDI